MSVDFDRMAAHLPADQRKQLSRQYRRGAKNETTAFLSAFFLGIFGMHHFYLGEWTRGLTHLILPVLAALVALAGALGNLPLAPVALVVAALLLASLIWEVVDLFGVDEKVRELNLALAESLIGAGALADSSPLTDAVARLDNAVAGPSANVESGVALAGVITAEDIAEARAMAGEHNNAIMEEYDATTTRFISEDPNATSPGKPGEWSETIPYEPGPQPQPEPLAASGATDPSAGDTLDMPAPEYVTHTHSETENSVTDSYEFDRAPDATQPMARPTVRESEAKTWPDHPPLEEAAGTMGAGTMGAAALVAGAAGAGAGAAGPDVTDHHAYFPQTRPIADVEGAGAVPLYVALPEETQPSAPVPTITPTPAPAPVADAGAGGVTPLAVDASTVARDATDSHHHVPHAGLVADVEANPGQPVYVDLPAETSRPPAPPVAPVRPAPPISEPSGQPPMAPGIGAAHDAAPETAPSSGPLMKRIRMKRQIVVDGQVVREEVVEKLVPVETDTTALVAQMDNELGHATKEEIAHMANLDPNSSLDVRHRLDMPHQSEETPTE